MVERKRWPDRVEDKRVDAIALTLDNDYLNLQHYEALRRGDLVEAARVADEINKKNREIRKLLQEAKREA